MTQIQTILQKKYILWSLVLACMLTIFLLSHLNAVKPWYLAGQVLITVTQTQDEVADMDFNEEIQYYSEEGQSNNIILLRKIAHVIEYFGLSILLINALWSRQIEKTWSLQKVFLTSLLIVILYASFDEAHQLRIPGRTGDIKDVLIDSAGGVLGIPFVYAIMNAIKRRDTI